MHYALTHEWTLYDGVMWSQTVNNSKDEIYDAHIRSDDALHRNSIKIVMK